MKNLTWQKKPALVPAFAMPICASTSDAARVRVDVDGVRMTSTAVHYRPGIHAWSPPLS